MLGLGSWPIIKQASGKETVLDAVSDMAVNPYDVTAAGVLVIVHWLTRERRIGRLAKD